MNLLLHQSNSIIEYIDVQNIAIHRDSKPIILQDYDSDYIMAALYVNDGDYKGSIHQTNSMI